MELRIWQLTELGTRAARNQFNPNEPTYKIMSFLDFMGTATTQQIADHVLSFFPELSYGDISVEIHRLARLGLVTEATRRVVEENTISSGGY